MLVLQREVGVQAARPGRPDRPARPARPEIWRKNLAQKSGARIWCKNLIMSVNTIDEQKKNPKSAKIWHPDRPP